MDKLFINRTLLNPSYIKKFLLLFIIILYKKSLKYRSSNNLARTFFWYWILNNDKLLSYSSKFIKIQSP